MFFIKFPLSRSFPSSFRLPIPLKASRKDVKTALTAAIDATNKTETTRKTVLIGEAFAFVPLDENFDAAPFRRLLLVSGLANRRSGTRRRPKLLFPIVKIVASRLFFE